MKYLGQGLSCSKNDQEKSETKKMKAIELKKKCTGKRNYI